MACDKEYYIQYGEAKLTDSFSAKNEIHGELTNLLHSLSFPSMSAMAFYQFLDVYV